MSGIGKALRAAVGNAIVWGATWTGLAMLTMVGLRAIGRIPVTLGILDYLGMALRIGFLGGLVGVAFAAYLRVAQRGRRLGDLSALRFGIGGGIATGILVPTVMQLSSLISGGTFVPWEYLNEDIVIVTVFGGVAAGISIKLAQLASRVVPDEAPAGIDRSEVLNRLGPVNEADRFAESARTAEEHALDRP